VSRRFSILLLLGTAMFLSACTSESTRNREMARLTGGGDVRAGAVAIRHYGCQGCHVIPGIPGANGVVGPPLVGLKTRVYIAGSLPNTTNNLMQWIQKPQELRPHTAMPDMNVTDRESRDITAYLYKVGSQ
jgi:cytochrome c